MDLALYDAEIGYYARVARRSGRAGDFFTSVDVGPIFGQLIARQVAEMANLLTVDRRPFAELTVVPSSVEERLSTVDLVEAGAGDGRLAADILRAARAQHPSLYSCLHLHLVAASASARMAQAETLGDLADRLASSGPDLPESFEGILLANELLDAMPVHQIVM